MTQVPNFCPLWNGNDRWSFLLFQISFFLFLWLFCFFYHCIFRSATHSGWSQNLNLRWVFYKCSTSDRLQILNVFAYFLSQSAKSSKWTLNLDLWWWGKCSTAVLPLMEHYFLPFSPFRWHLQWLDLKPRSQATVLSLFYLRQVTALIHFNHFPSTSVISGCCTQTLGPRQWGECSTFLMFQVSFILVLWITTFKLIAIFSLTVPRPASGH
jgi:hypothetical protein